MKQAILTDYQLVKEDPPFPYLTWSEDAVKSWLKRQGFDLTKEVWSLTDPASARRVFTQADNEITPIPR